MAVVLNMRAKTPTGATIIAISISLWLAANMPSITDFTGAAVWGSMVASAIPKKTAKTMNCRTPPRFGALADSVPVPQSGVVAPSSRIPTRNKVATFSSRIVKGPFSGDYSFTHLVTVGEMPWSSCDSRVSRDLKIHTTLMTRSLTRGPTKEKGMAMITLDTVDAALAQKFDLAWKKCP